MNRPRLLPLLLAAGALCVPTALLAPASGEVAARATDSPAGKALPPVVLDQEGHAEFYGYDALATSDGTTYVGWIAAHNGADRTVQLCTIPQGSANCTSKQEIASLGLGSAAGLKMLQVGGMVVLVWYHENDTGPGEIAVAPVSGGVLGAATDVTTAPDNGGLYDATVAPDGDIWAVTFGPSGDTMQIHPGLGNPTVDRNPSNLVGSARIAFDHDEAVVVFSDYGSISSPVRVIAQNPDDSWRAAATVPKTWSLGGSFDLVRRGQTARLVTSVPNAGYYPQIAAWKGTAFGAFSRTGYNGSCEWTTHDLYADASGRIADASYSCKTVRIFNQPQGGRGRAATWSDSHTPTSGTNTFGSNGPQIATTPRGTGWIVFSRQNATAGQSDQLMAAPVRLPALMRTVSDGSPGGRATVTGPVSCMPASDAAVSVAARRASGWSVVSKSLTRDGNSQGATLHGENLAPGTSHTLTGKVVFGKGGQRATAIARLTFTACPNPSAFGSF